MLTVVIASCATLAATQPAPAAATGTVRSDSLWAPSLGVWRRLVVYLPPSYARDTGRRYPVAYYLHGMWGGESDWSTQGNIQAIADSLIARGIRS